MIKTPHFDIYEKLKNDYPLYSFWQNGHIKLRITGYVDCYHIKYDYYINSIAVANNRIKSISELVRYFKKIDI